MSLTFFTANVCFLLGVLGAGYHISCLFIKDDPAFHLIWALIYLSGSIILGVLMRQHIDLKRRITELENKKKDDGDVFL